MKSSNVLINASVKVPIYNQRVRLIVVEKNLGAEVKRLLQCDGVEDSYEAVTMSRGGDVAICLIRALVCHRTIGHEVYHAVNDIMRHVTHPPDRSHHEPDSYLCGWITEWIYRKLNKHGVSVKQ